MTTIIVGAGMAGLLAGCMIRDHHIIESQPSLPNNHHAVLRFRSSVVGDVVGIPFKKVRMMKCVQSWQNPVADQLSYSYKTNGTAQLRSAISATGELSDRFIAPSDFIQRMAEMCTIQLGTDFDPNLSPGSPIISTMPMPALMLALGWKNIPEFKTHKGFILQRSLKDVDAYCTVYDPDPSSAITRVSITGDKLIAELAWPQETGKVLARAMDLLGLPDRLVIASNDGWREQKYAKILPISDDVRKNFIMWATEKFDIYSLGRFATWRPGLLMDDIVNDVRVIQRLINGGSSYHHKKG